MKTALITTLIISLIAATALAAERGKGAQGSKQTIEQKKAEILQHINERISNSQAEVSCVQAATTHEALRACKEKYRPHRANDERQGRKEQQQPPRED